MAKQDPVVETVEVVAEEVAPVQYRQVSLRVPEDLYAKVEYFRHDNRIDKRSDAFVRVLVAGIGNVTAGE